MTSWLNNNFKLLALTLLAMLSSSVVWGGDVTLNASDYSTWTTNGDHSTTISGVTFNFSGGTTKSKYYDDGIRTYENCVITISSSNTITGIAFTYTVSKKGYFKTVTPGTWNGTSKQWSGSATSIAFTVGHESGTENGQVRITQIVVTTAASKTLSSISVKTEPSKTTYTEGDKFDPTGLVITKTYDDSSTEDLAYAGHESDFTFSPSTSTALTTSNTSVTITVGDKSTTQSITVNAKSKYTVTFYNAGEVVKTVSDVTEGTLFSAIKPTIGTGSGQLNIESCDNSSTHFMGWTTEESFQKQKTAPPYVADNDAINDNMTVRAVWAAEE